MSEEKAQTLSIPHFPHEELHSALNEKRHRKKNKHHKQKEAKQIQLFGQSVLCYPTVKVLVGPVIGDVTTTTAIVLAEISAHHTLSVGAVDPEGNLHKVTKVVNSNLPYNFYFENLKPGTKYNVFLEGVTKKCARMNVGSFTTFPENPKKLKIAIVSCDRPERHLPGEKLMWKVLAERISKGEIDLLVHIGDQVYAQKESVDAAAIYNHSDHEDQTDQKLRLRRLYHTYNSARNRLADVYRFTWSLPYTAKCLGNVPNLMIWSDNDIYNDFTIAEDVPPILIKLGQQTYRMYQRALWDDDIFDDTKHTEEQHFHKYGATGVLVLDMRGNRVDPEGNQYPDKPIISDNQWKQIEEFVADDNLKALIVCAEIPFVSESPEKVKSQVAKFPFLKDHWAYCEAELFRLLDTLFDWKAAGAGKKDFVLVGGDIHVGVTSVIKDNKTGLEVKQITTSPITNHVCDYYPAREGSISERYSYTHVPLDHQKNYGYFEVDVAEDGSATIQSQLIGDKMC